MSKMHVQCRKLVTFSGWAHKLFMFDFGNTAIVNPFATPGSSYSSVQNKSLEELFLECGNGFYLTDVQGLHAGINVINGDFSLQAQGFEIVDGKLGKPVNLVVASGNFKKLFNEVMAIGNDLNFKTGNIGAPTLLVSELSISGK